jgi:hypothetical protein
MRARDGPSIGAYFDADAARAPDEESGFPVAALLVRCFAERIWERFMDALDHDADHHLTLDDVDDLSSAVRACQHAHVTLASSSRRQLRHRDSRMLVRSRFVCAVLVPPQHDGTLHRNDLLVGVQTVLGLEERDTVLVDAMLDVAGARPSKRTSNRRPSRVELEQVNAMRDRWDALEKGDAILEELAEDIVVQELANRGL